MEEMNTPASPSLRILIRGAGEMATGVAHRLARCGYPVIMTEIEKPLAIRRGVAFAEAIYAGTFMVEGLESRRTNTIEAVASAWKQKVIAVVVDPDLKLLAPLIDPRSTLIIDARMFKKTPKDSYPPHRALIGLGPGFLAPENARFVVETNRGHHLGRVIETGSAQPDTGTPGELGGASQQRVVYAPQDGIFWETKSIGDPVGVGDMIGRVNESPVRVSLAGVLRGILHESTPVRKQVKVADVDPRGDRECCFLISDKARAIAGGVLEAVLRIQGE